MVKNETAGRQSGSRGLFREMDGPAPGDSLFRREDPSGGGMERFHVSAADAPEEVNADRTADRVTGGGSLFRAADGPGAEGGEAELASADLAEPGSALPAGLQASMGASIGADFSNVRVHTGAGADRASRSLSARAFAKGQDLYFRDGEYDPDSREGQHLIAHELAHVADGADGLHRVYNGPEFPNVGSALTAADRTGIETCIQSVRDTVGAADVAQMEEKYLKKSLEESKPTTADRDKLQDAWDALTTAKGYIGKINAVDKTGMSDTDKTALENYKTELQDQMGTNDEKLGKIKQILDEITPALEREVDMPLSDSVKNMLESPYFDQFFRAASQLQKAGKGGGFGEAEESAAEKAGSAGGGMSAEEKRAYIQHQNELRGMDTGIQKAKESSNWLGKTGEVLGTLGESGAELSESAGAVAAADATHKAHKEIDADDSVKDKDKAKEDAAAEAEEKGSAIADITASSAEGLGAIGAGFSVAQNSKDAAAQRKQDQRAKQSMRNIAGQLERTIPAQLADAPQSGPDSAARSRRIQKVCEQIKQSKFNDGKAPLAQLISDAMDDSPDLKPELSNRQKSLLSTLQALEASRASSKEGAQKLRRDAIFGAFDVLGAGLKSAGGILSGIGVLMGSTASSLLGAILSLAGGIIGQISAIRGKLSGGGEGGEGGEEDEQAKKMAACRSAVQQMSGLPPMRDKAVEALKKKAGGDTAQRVGSVTMERAEQYAAAFYTIESANVNMSDILFAIEKGEFGKGAGTDHAKSTQDSLKDMYANLSFS